MKTVFTLAASFLTESGHDRAYHESLQKAFQGLGYRVFTFIPHACQVKNLGPQWVRFFRAPSYRFLDYLRLLRRNDAQILFLESFSLREFSFLVSILLFRRSWELWLVFRDGFENAPRKQKAYAWITRLLRGRARYFSDSSLVIRTLAPLFKQPMTLLPIPHTAHLPPRTTPNPKICLWVPGKLRAEKGLESILAFCKSKDPALQQMKLCIESNELFRQQLNIEIEWIPSNLSRGDYLKQFHRTDALLLPYDPALFRSRTSGPFVEAIGMDKSVFTRSGSWLAHELLQYGLTEWILDWEARSAPSALLRGLNSNKAVQMSAAYRGFHTEESFQQHLFN